MACGGSDTEPGLELPAAPAPGTSAGLPPITSSPPASATVVTGEGAASVALGFGGVSPLYQGYFTTEDWVGRLGRDLGGCFDGTVAVLITYDSENHVGRILVQTGLAELGCRPKAGPDGVDLAALRPVGAALARYRDTVAGARDLRVGSFRTGLRLVQRGEICDLYFGGQFPPDGSRFSPCMGLRGFEVCVGDRHEGVLTLPWPPGEGREVLSTCVGG